MTVNNRVRKKFKELAANNQKGLITYVTVGDPDLETTIQLVETMEKAGADLLELGIPFSDPVADGPSIQRASYRALTKGIRVATIIQAAARIRARVENPLIFMTYYNPVFQYGLEKFTQDAVRAGIDGLIIPDLPSEEAEPLLQITDQSGLELIPLVAPTTTRQRLKNIGTCARGFVYCVSVTGVTGARERIDTDLAQFTGRVRKYIDLPIAIGFGLAGPQQAAAVAPFCDAVVIGSAIVNIVAEQGPAANPAVARLVCEIKSALG
jgi:tryptophan synthase alpha chain